MLARIAGLLLFSPLLAQASLPTSWKAVSTLLLAFLLSILHSPLAASLPLPHQGLASYFFSNLIVETAIGYLIGFCFAIVFEALLLGGEMTGLMIGFSAAEMVDPFGQASSSLIGKLFVTLGAVLLFSFDVHHLLLRLVNESFLTIPLSHLYLSQEALSELTQGTGRLFHYALKFASIPFAIMMLLNIGLGFLGRVMPQTNLLMLSFPLKIAAGYYALIVAISTFPLIVQHAFLEFRNLSKLMLSLS